ncbi:hypothetical protein Tco_0730673 [Tanacetum coccineum]|uniref:Uncharacterized protein n=1 Tax=Tanacetum coccineum TaxID=301880 RepID=A0ABQ4YTB1_9ASTR
MEDQRNKFAPYPLPPQEGNMNGWLIDDANDSDLESTASNQPISLTMEAIENTTRPPLKSSLTKGLGFVKTESSPPPTKLLPLVDDDVGEEKAIENKVIVDNNIENESLEVDKILRDIRLKKGTDSANITRKRSNPNKHGHENGKECTIAGHLIVELIPMLKMDLVALDDELAMEEFIGLY